MEGRELGISNSGLPYPGSPYTQTCTYDPKPLNLHIPAGELVQPVLHGGLNGDISTLSVVGGMQGEMVSGSR